MRINGKSASVQVRGLLKYLAELKGWHFSESCVLYNGIVRLAGACPVDIRPIGSRTNRCYIFACEMIVLITY
jgi:hypothetical protein